MGALKHSPGGCHCCVAGCGVVSLPTTLFFTIAGIGPISLLGPGGTSGLWASSVGAIHAPGSEVLDTVLCTHAGFVEMFAQFNLLTVANGLGQCFNLGINARYCSCSGSCSAQFSGSTGTKAGSALGVGQVTVTGVLNSFTWSPFSSSWTFGTGWDVIPNIGTTGPFCGLPATPLPLVPPISGAATLTH